MYFSCIIATIHIFSDARFLEGDEGEDTCLISQEDIADAVDITSGAKVMINTTVKDFFVTRSYIFSFIDS